ncbi:MAG: gas vesicle protein, partial [Actinomycetota bacterium]|nr:gas vesicle protein [Actinomycetota bacterium]
GIVVAGDIAINLLDIELLTIKLRLLIASADTAKKMGISWWENDPFLTGESTSNELGSSDNHGAIEQRLERIEEALGAITSSSNGHER